MSAIEEADCGYAVGSGDDHWTGRAEAALKNAFGPAAVPFIVLDGTGADSVALQSVVRPFNSIICAETGHIYVDECGAPARMTGARLTPVSTPDGKLTPELVARSA